MKRINLYGGKYTVVNELNKGGSLYALRHGEKWRSLAGDGLILAMFHKIEELTNQKVDYEKSLMEITAQHDNTSGKRLKEIANKALNKHNPHRSCPNCHDDCIGWILEGQPCGRDLS